MRKGFGEWRLGTVPVIDIADLAVRTGKKALTFLSQVGQSGEQWGKVGALPSYAD